MNFTRMFLKIRLLVIFALKMYFIIVEQLAFPQGFVMLAGFSWMPSVEIHFAGVLLCKITHLTLSTKRLVNTAISSIKTWI